jgi:hypothetical protein
MIRVEKNRMAIKQFFIQVTVQTNPTALSFTVDGTTYTATKQWDGLITETATFIHN